MKLDVCFTPGDFQPELNSAPVGIVIDAFRATSSIVTAFAHHCSKLIPVTTVEEALALKETQFPEALLTGERHGRLIPGFNLGNSPFEYRDVAGKTIIMSTTNGTVALQKASSCETVYAAAFINSAAVCRTVESVGKDVVIICAGSEGRFSVEDTLCAGLIADRLSSIAVLADRALAAQAMYQGFSNDLVNRVAVSSHAKYLTNIGFADDIDYCLQLDVLNVVPKFTQGMITL